MVLQQIKNILFFTFFFLTAILFIPGASFANGGDQRVVEGKYLINLSRSPFTPKVGDNVAMIASFVDIQTDKIINEDIIVKVRIAKVGGENGRSFIFEQDDLRVKGGILEFTYTFTEPGLHEVFFDFSSASNPQKIYNAPDFLLDIQKASTQEAQTLFIPLGILIGAVGFMVGWVIKMSR